MTGGRLGYWNREWGEWMQHRPDRHELEEDNQMHIRVVERLCAKIEPWEWAVFGHWPGSRDDIWNHRRATLGRPTLAGDRPQCHSTEHDLLWYLADLKKRLKLLRGTSG